MNTIKTIINKYTIALMLLCTSQIIWAQQDPQYTQYMYNTMSVNPAYAGSRGNTSIIGLYRTQWVGLDGAPTTQTLGIDTPLGDKTGLGLSLVNDEIGPAKETYVDANFSYTIDVGIDRHLSFGLKAGIHLLDVDFSRGSAQQQGDPNLTNINSQLSPTVGAGVYYHSQKWYLGLSTPNLLKTDHYDDIQQSTAVERLHFFAIAGYVFDINQNLKFKPAVLAKAVDGAPLSLDGSANFLINDKLTLGLGYRWDAAVSALAGFQISDNLFAGYAFDYTTTELNNYNSGSHEIMLRYDITSNPKKLKSPRFF